MKPWLGFDVEVRLVNGFYKPFKLTAANKSFEKVFDPGGSISSDEFLEFISELPYKFKIAGYFTQAQIQVCLNDLPNELVHELFRPELRHDEYIDRSVRYRHWVIKRIATKLSVIKTKDPLINPKLSEKDIRGSHRYLWDVGWIFNEPLNDALDAFDINYPTDSVERCLAISELMSKLDKALKDLDNAALNISHYMTTWFSAGSIARAILDKHHIGYQVELHNALPQDQRIPYDIIYWAYFGGRSELIRQGTFKNVSEYDLRNAYPNALKELHCFHSGYEFVKEKKFNYQFKKSALYSVDFKFTGEKKNWIYMPLPVRKYQGQLIYPLEGRGWYWGHELVGLTDFPIKLTYHGHYQRIFDCICQPFNWIEKLIKACDYFPHRGVLKTALASIFGKFASSLSPKYYNLIYASQITSVTRAKIFQLARCFDETIAFATDAIFVLDDTEKSFPGVKMIKHSEGTFVKPGLYFLSDKPRTQGLPYAEAIKHEEEFRKELEGDMNPVKVVFKDQFYSIPLSFLHDAQSDKHKRCYKFDYLKFVSLDLQPKRVGALPPVRVLDPAPYDPEYPLPPEVLEDGLVFHNGLHGAFLNG